MSTALGGGFTEPPRDAAHAFRALMTAMARPGKIEDVEGASPPGPLSVAAGVLLLTLADNGTPVHLAGNTDCQDVRDWLRFHTGAPIVGPATCSFAVGDWQALQPLSSFSVGTPEYPDRSATLIVEVDTLEARGVALEGPGIKAQAELSLPEREAFQANGRRFPLGLDFYFTCGARLAALPRSTRVI